MTPEPGTDSNLDLLEALGNRIRSARKERGFSQVTLAAACGLHVSHLSKIERGGSNATVGSLMAIATALKIDMGDLFSELASTSSRQTPA